MTSAVAEEIDCPIQPGRFTGVIMQFEFARREHTVLSQARAYQGNICHSHTTPLFSFGHDLPLTPASFYFFLLALQSNMSHDNEELIDYEDENDIVTHGPGASVAARAGDNGDKEKKNFSGIHSTGFR